MRQRGWAIDGGSRARRTGWRTPPNEISWGFMKLLREGNKTRRVYGVNPYVEVYRFHDELYGLYNQGCDGGADAWAWLTVGPSSAMLIDTAFGLGDMKGLVDAILADPENCDWRSESYAKGGALVVGRYARHIPRFSVVFYGYKKG